MHFDQNHGFFFFERVNHGCFVTNGDDTKLHSETEFEQVYPETVPSIFYMQRHMFFICVEMIWFFIAVAYVKIVESSKIVILMMMTFGQSRGTLGTRFLFHTYSHIRTTDTHLFGAERATVLQGNKLVPIWNSNALRR